MKKKTTKPFFSRSIPKIMQYLMKEWGLTNTNQICAVKIAWDAAALLDKTISVSFSVLKILVTIICAQLRSFRNGTFFGDFIYKIQKVNGTSHWMLGPVQSDFVIFFQKIIGIPVGTWPSYPMKFITLT